MKRKFTTVLVAALLFSFPLEAASREPVRANHGMVASVSAIASQVGVDVMRKGGNAVDAAVAVAFALSVVWPSAGNIAGGGFMVIRDANGKAEVVDYREVAPLAATRDMYLDEEGQVIPKESTLGYKAVGVPGTVAGLALAHKRHGKLKWSELVEPARKLAEQGFIVNEFLERSLSSKENSARLSSFPESRRIYLRNGKPYKRGETFRQPELAATLARIQREGPREFYEGKTADLLVADLRAHGGIITARDLREYQPRIREPLRGTYRGYEILTMPPPSSGGAVLLEMLNILEHFDLRTTSLNASSELSVLIPAMQLAYADRAAYMGDTDFVKVPIAGIVSKKYGAAQAKRIDPSRSVPSAEMSAGEPTGYESVETTHFSIIDAEGTIVSNTYTLNDSYGSAATVPGAGFLLNDEMDDFTSKPGVPNLYGLLQSEANAILPRKRPLSAMTPTIVLSGGKPLLAVGSPGGGSIIDTVLQVIINVIDFDMNIQQAIDTPRFHHQWMPDHIFWEKDGVNDDTRRAMEAKGYKFKPGAGYTEGDLYIGDAQGVMIDKSNGDRLGASDPRRGGQAIGY